VGAAPVLECADVSPGSLNVPGDPPLYVSPVMERVQSCDELGSFYLAWKDFLSGMNLCMNMYNDHSANIEGVFKAWACGASTQDGALGSSFGAGD